MAMILLLNNVVEVGMKVTKFEERLVKDIITKHAVRVVGVDNAQSFYTRMRKIFVEKGEGKFIRGAVREGGLIYFWYYPAYRAISLCKKVEEFAIDVIYPKDGIAGGDLAQYERESLNAFGILPEWVDEIEDSGMEPGAIKFSADYLDRVEKGKAFAEDFVDYVNNSKYTLEHKMMLVRKINEISQEKIIHRPADYVPEPDIMPDSRNSVVSQNDIINLIKKLGEQSQ